MKSKMLLLLLPLTLSIFSAHADIAENKETEISRQDQVVYVNPDQLDWKETVYQGTEVTTIFGDPAKPGTTYAIRFKFPAGTIVPAHRHSQDEFMTVISGSLNVGIGKSVDLDNTVYLPQGGAVGIPGNVPHYAWTDEDTIIQVHAMGPRDTTFVDPQDN